MTITADIVEGICCAKLIVLWMLDDSAGKRVETSHGNNLLGYRVLLENNRYIKLENIDENSITYFDIKTIVGSQREKRMQYLVVSRRSGSGSNGS